MKFESKRKTLEVTIDGQAYKMSLPSMGDSDELEMELQKSDGKGAISCYQNFFAKLGLPVEAQKKMDNLDYLDFITFVLNPKKN